MTRNKGRLNPKVVGSEFVKYFVFYIFDWDAGRYAALCSNAPMEVLYLREIMFEIRRLVSDVSQVTNTIHTVFGQVRLNCSFTVDFLYETK